MTGLLRIGIFILAFCSNATAMHVKPQGSGKVEVNGQILASACSIHIDDVWQEIPFGLISVQRTIDQRHIETRPIDIRLVNCRLEKEDGGLWKNVIVTFDGDPTPSSKELFSVNGDAQGISLLLTDSEGKHALPGHPLSEIALQETNNSLHYKLSVVPNGNELKEGDWFSFIRFMVSYE